MVVDATFCAAMPDNSEEAKNTFSRTEIFWPDCCEIRVDEYP